MSAVRDRHFELIVFQTQVNGRDVKGLCKDGEILRNVE